MPIKVSAFPPCSNAWGRMTKKTAPSIAPTAKLTSVEIELKRNRDATPPAKTALAPPPTILAKTIQEKTDMATDYTGGGKRKWEDGLGSCLGPESSQIKDAMRPVIPSRRCEKKRSESV